MTIERLDFKPHSGIDFSQTSWSPEAYVLFGQIVEAKYHMERSQDMVKNAESRMNSCLHSYENFGHYDDCGESYKSDYLKAKGVFDALEKTKIKDDEGLFVRKFKYFQAVHNEYYKEMRKILENQNKYRKAFTQAQHELINLMAKFSNSLLVSHTGTAIKKQLKDLGRPELKSFQTLCDSLDSAESRDRAYRIKVGGDKLADDIIAVATMIVEHPDVLTLEWFIESHSGDNNICTLSSAQRSLGKMKKRAQIVLDSNKNLKKLLSVM